MSSVFCICHSALACPHESGECGIQYFVCLWIPVTRYLPSQAQASRAQVPAYAGTGFTGMMKHRTFVMQFSIAYLTQLNIIFLDRK
jgi:hypothetical protein